jgi:glyoxylase-like metal-dependent hydrolase (beta-lactamase superfamily II)
MQQEIRTIELGGVSCYLVAGRDGFVLVDTGIFAKRSAVEKALAGAGCEPGSLRLIILTHGHVDHTDNCAYLRDRLGAPVAMHRGDAAMVARDDAPWDRTARPEKVPISGRIITLVGGLVLLFSGRRGKFDGFMPDICLEDGQDLSAYGLDAKVLHLPGHSQGSIGILTAGGDLFCGDLLMNMFKPARHFLILDRASFEASLARVLAMDVHTVYPGHGKPFPMARLTKSRA